MVVRAESFYKFGASAAHSMSLICQRPIWLAYCQVYFNQRRLSTRQELAEILSKGAEKPKPLAMQGALELSFLATQNI
jgi:hypothetical protein